MKKRRESVQRRVGNVPLVGGVLKQVVVAKHATKELEKEHATKTQLDEAHGGAIMTNEEVVDRLIARNQAPPPRPRMLSPSVASPASRLGAFAPRPHPTRCCSPHPEDVASPERPAAPLLLTRCRAFHASLPAVVPARPGGHGHRSCHDDPGPHARLHRPPPLHCSQARVGRTRPRTALWRAKCTDA